jgi:FixJ family two-component response regulator
MTGLEFIATLRAQGVKVPALLTSGNFTLVAKRQASVAGIPVIEKPFLGNSLIDAIRTAVGTKPS